MRNSLRAALSCLILLGAAAPVSAQSSAILPVPLKPVVPAEQRSCTQRTPTGLGYSVLRYGTGRRPTPADIALVQYIGYLAADGTVFDQSPEGPVPLPVVGLIDGFSEGLQLMPQGSIYRFCIPAPLAYGAEGVNIIPPNADLVFQVELTDVRTRQEFEAGMKENTDPATDAAD